MTDPWDLDEATIKFFDNICAKSKKICGMCDLKIERPTKDKLGEHAGAVYCESVTFNHPIDKKKTYKLCGNCYAGLSAGEGEK